MSQKLRVGTRTPAALKSSSGFDLGWLKKWLQQQLMGSSDHLLPLGAKQWNPGWGDLSLKGRYGYDEE